MKKVLSIILMLVMGVALTTAVNAVTPNEDLKAFLSGEFTVAGEKMKLSSADLVQVDRYLADNPVTEEQVADIKAKVNDAVEYVNNTGVTDLSKLTTEQKKTVLSKANAAAAVVGLTIDVNTKEGTVFVLSGSDVVVEKSIDDTFKRTGGQEVMPIVILSALAIIAIAGAAYVKRNK